MSNDHNAPCESLSGFRRMVIGIMGIEALFVMAALSLTVGVMNRMSAVSERQIQIAERQRVIEKKADDALTSANKALAISGKSEADIAWIREGFTELKMLVRDAVQNRPKAYRQTP